MLLHGGRGDVANVRVFVIFGLFLYAFSFFNLLLFHFLASSGLEQLILLLLRHNNVTFGLISHINSFDLVVLALVDVFECEHCFLAHQGHLLVGPNFGAVVSLLLDLVLKLFDGVLKFLRVILALLRTLQEELALFVELGLHLLLDHHLLFHALDELVPEVLDVVDEHLVGVVSLFVGVVPRCLGRDLAHVVFVQVLLLRLGDLGGLREAHGGLRLVSLGG